MEIKQLLENTLRKEPNYLTDNGDVKKWVVISKAQNFDETLIGLLLDQPRLKTEFFREIHGHWIFDQNRFTDFIEQKEYLEDSFTRYKNKIGLTIGSKFLGQRNEVSLVWPYKDCVLEDGQSREEQKRNEIFFNELLAQDEITQLLEPKVLTNAKHFTSNNEQKFDKFNRNEQGTITDNLLIKGNNLLALHSLKKKFAGKIKLIYIDPPYNTGNDGFKYNDSFNHSTWLTFMKNRLEIARKLLREDGVIFVSLDDKEAHYCKILMDEIFGRENFIADICHKARASVSNDKIISPNHNHILLFAKKERTVFSKKNQFGEKNELKGFTLKDDKGNYKLVPVDGPGGDKKGNPYYEFLGVIGYWRFSQDRMQRMYEENLIVKKGNSLYQKYYEEKAKNSRKTTTTWWDNGFLTSSATGELKTLMESENPFSNPKNINLLKHIVDLWVREKDDIVLDFFAGSSTTAQAVLDLNKEDGGNRQFILCEQMEYVENVTTERIKKVIEKNQEGSFIYLELKKYNETFIEQIQEANTTEELLEIWEAMKERSFLNYNIDIKAQDTHIEEFKTLSIEQQKQHLAQLLDKNQLYVPLSAMNDAQYGVTEDEKALTKVFYS
ncbi:MAG: DNA methyltransferase [Emticicia sp.]